MSDATDLVFAYSIATESPDPSTQNGAVLRWPNGRIIRPTGECNDFPRGTFPSARTLTRPIKYQFIEHAERGALYAAARFGICTNGLTMVACWASCADCARAIVQSGIRTLVRHNPPTDDGSSQRWLDSIKIGDEILNAGGVEIVEFTDPLPGAPKILRDGELWQP